MEYHWTRWVIVEKKTFFQFNVLQTPPESGRSITAETDSLLITVISYICCIGCNDVIKVLLFSGVNLGTWVGVSLGSSSRYGVNQLYLRSILSCATLCDLSCTRSFQFGGILPPPMNGTVENPSSNTTWNWGKTWPVSRLINRAIDPAWNGEWPIYIPEREQGYNLGSPDIFLCNIASKTWTGNSCVVIFKSNIYCFACKLLHGSNTIIIYLE